MGVGPGVDSVGRHGVVQVEEEVADKESFRKRIIVCDDLGSRIITRWDREYGKA